MSNKFISIGNNIFQKSQIKDIAFNSDGTVISVSLIESSSRRIEYNTSTQEEILMELNKE